MWFRLRAKRLLLQSEPDEAQGEPSALQDLLEEELDPAERNGDGGSAHVLDADPESEVRRRAGSGFSTEQSLEE